MSGNMIVASDRLCPLILVDDFDRYTEGLHWSISDKRASADDRSNLFGIRAVSFKKKTKKQRASSCTIVLGENLLMPTYQGVSGVVKEQYILPIL